MRRQGHSGYDDAGILVGPLLVADWPATHAAHARCRADEDRPTALPSRRTASTGNNAGELGHVLGRNDLMGSEGIVSGCDRLEKPAETTGCSLGVEVEPHAEIVAPVVHQLEKTCRRACAVGSGAPHAGQVEGCASRPTGRCRWIGCCSRTPKSGAPATLRGHRWPRAGRRLTRIDE